MIDVLDIPELAIGVDVVVEVADAYVAGRQDQVPGQPLTYGQSITDGCIDWDTTVVALERLALAVEQRRIANREAVKLGA